MPKWQKLDEVLALAEYPNVALKMCGPAGLSEEGYPFADVWPNVERLLEAFGVDRVGWASDIGRFRGRIAWSIRVPGTEGHYPGKHNYMESLGFFLYSDLSDDDKAKLLGQTTRRLLKWPSAQDAEGRSTSVSAS
jgi:L-fuconolactonase